MKNFETILNNREEVMSVGHAIDKQFEEVPGYLWFDGNKKNESQAKRNFRNPLVNKKKNES